MLSEMSGSFKCRKNEKERFIFMEGTELVAFNIIASVGTARSNYIAAIDEAAAGNYEAKAQENVAVSISEDGKTVDITGFDYSTHFQAASTAEDDHDGANKQTAKIVVSFPIQARPSAVTGGSVATNGEASGIYLNADDTDYIMFFKLCKKLLYIIKFS